MARKDAKPGNTEQIAERRVKAFELRKKGNNYREIAKELGVTAPTILADVRAVLHELSKEQQKEAADYKVLELDRLETLQVKMWELAINGDQGAVDRVLRIQERRAKLLGLDAPTKADVTSNGETLKAYVNVQVDKV
jgi:orotate phosphoribosyltransferase-like protein